ncbi:hypothetical protein [Janthinobacterium sp. 78]|uniref:hypothetical protein n=1 Tax=Janthinobacterium sp. 78 TaxID=2135631 RepID=UPI000E315C22|nr:hypothetical protein [Janthinobacterium sp. 78]
MIARVSGSFAEQFGRALTVSIEKVRILGDLPHTILAGAAVQGIQATSAHIAYDEAAHIEKAVLHQVSLGVKAVNTVERDTLQRRAKLLILSPFPCIHRRLALRYGRFRRSPERITFRLGSCQASLRALHLQVTFHFSDCHQHPAHRVRCRSSLAGSKLAIREPFL